MSDVDLKYPEIRESKPISLTNKLQFGDYEYPGWRILQSESPVTNAHVYCQAQPKVQTKASAFG